MSHECASILWLIGATAATATTKASRDISFARYVSVWPGWRHVVNEGHGQQISTTTWTQFFARSAWSNQLTSRWHYISLLNKFRMPFLFSLISLKNNVKLYFYASLRFCWSLQITSHLNTWSQIATKSVDRMRENIHFFTS